jgi:transposase
MMDTTFVLHAGRRLPMTSTWSLRSGVRFCRDPLVERQRIRQRDPDLDRLTAHVSTFAKMMIGRHGDRLDDWITAAEQDTLAPLASFARNLRRDYDAVRNGLTLPHSSGPVEGAINRLKMLKRQMFGRANLDLLRKRVLLA